jgi:hypothetical protein
MSLEEYILVDQKGPISKVAKAYDLIATHISDQFLD